MDALLRSLLLAVDPERAHSWALRCLDIAAGLGWRNTTPPTVASEPVDVMGLRFRNPVGVAAGLDKNGDHIGGLAALGFGFIEVGTVTPRAQRGNDRPRLFRVPGRRAVINRLGFNNKGVDYLVDRLAEQHSEPVIGVNIGKNRDTELARAVDDYAHAFMRVAPMADYVTVNLSSPNTPGLRALQSGDALTELLGELKQRQRASAADQGRYVPLVVKLAPDMTDDELVTLGRALVDAEVDGIAATNTTTDHSGVSGLRYGNEEGGVSGAPLMAPSTATLARLRGIVGPQVPLVGVGGILGGDDARAKYRAGADLVQVYTGLVYRGARLVREMRMASSEARGETP